MSRGGSGYDVVLVADCRFPGGTSTAIAEELRAQAAAGYRTGLLHRRSPVLRAERPIHPAIRGAIDAGFARPILDDGPIRAGLVVLHHPFAFLAPFPRPLPPIEAELRLLIAHQPPDDAFGAPAYDPVAVDGVAAEATGGRVAWAPIAPAVRRALALRAPGIALFDRDWVNVIDDEPWAAAASRRPARPPGRFVIGRHARPDPLKWPDSRAEALLAYPDDPGIEIRVLGGEKFLFERFAPVPANWTMLPFDAQPVAGFLAGLDLFVYYHASAWIEAFGRTVMEAMAVGTPCLLPPSFAETFGDAAAYAPIADAPAAIARLRASPGERDALAARGRALVATRFSPAVHVARLAALIGPPRPRDAPAVRTVPAPRRILFMSTNGVGIGHLVRLMAVARRLPAGWQPVFLTLSQALPLVAAQGWPVEYTPFHRALEADPALWNRHLTEAIEAVVETWAPRALVFDGNTPYQGLVDVLTRRPDLPGLWLRRPLWPAHADPSPLKRADAFALVIEPRDAAEARDSGPTAALRGRTARVEPITFLDQAEMLDRERARAEVGLAARRPAVLLQLGSGTNADIAAVVAAVAEPLRRAGAETRWLRWPIGEQADDASPGGIAPLTVFPAARILKAFDATISAAGYNSFHEILAAGLPAAFVPNLAPEMDDQLARARLAQDAGAAFLLTAEGADATAPALVESLLDPAQRARMAAAAARLARPNGAAATARIVVEHAERAA